MKKQLRLFYEYVFGRIPGSYGQDKIIKSYINWPKYLPLNAQIQHGWYSTDIPDLTRIEQIDIMLVWSKRIAEEWKKYSSKEVIVIGAPFLIYKERENIQKNPMAVGTVVFPNHSTPNSVEKYDVKEYCEQLKDIPDQFKPITVCLHYRDLEYYGPQFSSYGFSVVSAGDSRQPNCGFVRKYYEILKNHKYSCSNEIGSYTFYSVDLGIPFFMYGPESITVERGDEKKIIYKTDFRIRTRELFKEMRGDITREQADFVSSELGKYDRITSEELKKYLFYRLFFHEIPHYPIRFMKYILQNLT
jgi:hypothetical protein